MSQPQQLQSSPLLTAPPSASAAMGRIVWHDLLSADPARSLEFYTALFGWTASTTPMGALGDYVLLQLGEEGVGGIVSLAPARGAGSHMASHIGSHVGSQWIAYVTVPDVDEACERASALGGRACLSATDIPGVGRFAVVEDPSGAVVAPFSFPDGHVHPERLGPPSYGAFCWDELLTTDVEGAMRFHSALFGWRYEAVEADARCSCWLAKRGGREASGLLRMPDDAVASGARPHWLTYVHIADVHASVEHAARLGATVLVRLRNVPGIGRFAVVRDPTGALLALFQGPT